MSDTRNRIKKFEEIKFLSEQAAQRIRMGDHEGAKVLKKMIEEKLREKSKEQQESKVLQFKKRAK